MSFYELAANFFQFYQQCQKYPFQNEYRCLNNTILVGHLTCESQSLESFQLHPMVVIYFANKTKKKFKSPTVGDLYRSPTVAFALVTHGD